jgi:hypothetical protein
MSQFHLHGAVPLDSPAYVTRGFERRILTEVLAQNWVLLLGPREHGKTSGLVRVKVRLQEAGLTCCMIDLQDLPPCDSFPELLQWITSRVGRELGIRDFNEPAGADRNELLSWLQTVVPPEPTPLVLIVDEAPSIADDGLRNVFYGQIRAISTVRAETQPEDLPRRVRFIFSGTFRPETLVNPVNSPFNVCVRIETDDLTREQVHEISRNVHGQDAPPFVDRVYDLVGGQPYLVQEFLSRTLRADEEDREKAFNDAVDELRFSDHITHLFGRIIADQALPSIVSRMIAEGEVPMLPDEDYQYLTVLGLAKRDGARLVFRNRLYAELAQRSPGLRPANAGPTPGAHLFRLPDEAFSHMMDDYLKEFASSAQRGAAVAFNNGSYRLALVGFGMALEAILIDWLKTFSSADLTAAIDQATTANWNTRFEDKSDPTTWRLVNLLKVAREVSTSSHSVEPPEALREWRNIVHPSVAVQGGLAETDLEPDAQAAGGLFGMVLRDVRSAMT